MWKGANVRLEIVGGTTTFMTMAYILFVNGSVLGAAGLPAAQVLAVTALVAGVMTIAMGLVANYPFALAPGMGLNAYVAFHLVKAQGLTAAEAMGVIVVEGLVIALLVVTGFREAVLNAIPMTLKRAIGAGIGLFIALIGFGNGGVTLPGFENGPLLQLGPMASRPVLVFAVGLVLALVLITLKVKGALLLAILGATALSMALGLAPLPEEVVSVPDLSLVGRVSFGFWAKLGALGSVLAIFTVMLSDFFDTVGTAVGLGAEAGFLDKEGKLPRMQRVLLVDSLAAAVGGACSSSSATTYVESAAGVAEGARTGLASVVTGLWFLAAMWIAPLAGVVPRQATAAALVVVGFLMVSALREVDWKDPGEAAPAFLCTVGMPFTYSISDGIGLGVISYVLLKSLTGKLREVHLMMWLTAAAFLVYFALSQG
jgi:AGZA family xanthine/uracil permease-like MFS transporter